MNGGSYLNTRSPLRRLSRRKRHHLAWWKSQQLTSISRCKALKSREVMQWGLMSRIPGRIPPGAFIITRLRCRRFYIDQYSVSNVHFKAFLDDTQYHPKDDFNFLKDWKNGTYPDGWADKPVTWVSIEDARAYAAWAGKRLPHEWEWQYAAQGTHGRVYPWGNEWKADAVPVPEKGRALTRCRRQRCSPTGRESFQCHGFGGKHLAVDGRISGRAYARRDFARRQLLSTTRIDLVLPTSLPQRPAWKAAADGSQQR